MARIAVISDVHGNVPALDAVLEDLERQGADEVLVGGDLVGRGPEGSKVARRIRDLGWPCVRGNHEDYLLAFRRRSVPAAWLDQGTEEWAASRWMASELDDRDAAYLETLPLSLLSGRAPELLLVHGSPRSNSEGLGPWNTDQQLDDHLSGVSERVLVCAHTHRPMLRQLAHGLVVNVGAVGLPFNRDRRAQYAILERRGGRWSVEFRQVAYDLARVFEIYDRSGFLAHGGITAQLLKLELEQAAPFLVPFIKWAESRALPVHSAHLGAFLEFYDPDEPIAAFFSRLESPFR
jgi:predicted phosphodiesterase